MYIKVIMRCYFQTIIFKKNKQDLTILSWFETTTWEFAERVSNLQKKYMRMIVLL